MSDDHEHVCEVCGDKVHKRLTELEAGYQARIENTGHYDLCNALWPVMTGDKPCNCGKSGNTAALTRYVEKAVKERDERWRKALNYKVGWTLEEVERLHSPDYGEEGRSAK